MTRAFARVLTSTPTSLGDRADKAVKSVSQGIQGPRGVALLVFGTGDQYIPWAHERVCGSGCHSRVVAMVLGGCRARLWVGGWLIGWLHGGGGE